MGWAKGGGIAEQFITSSGFKGLSYKTKVALLFELIAILEGRDCDTLHELLGQDEAFDEAFYMINPDFGDDDEDLSDEEE